MSDTYAGYTNTLAYGPEAEAGAKTYPMQCGSIIHKNANGTRILTLGVNAMFSLPHILKNDGEVCAKYPYLEASPFSRFVFTLICKENGETTVLTGNMPADDIYDVTAETELVLQRTAFFEMLSAMKRKPAAASANNADTAPGNSPGFTVTFRMGNLKGKTPVGVLQEDAANGVKTLEAQKGFFQANLAKFPKNQEVIDAINDALALFQAGRLDGVQAAPATGGIIADLYAPDTLKPLASKPVNENGLPFVYQVKAGYDSSLRMPFSISITNGYAPVKKEENGQLKVMAREAVDVKTLTIKLTKKEWRTLLSQMGETYRAYNTTTFRNRYDAACKDQFRQMKAAQAAKAQSR